MLVSEQFYIKKQQPPRVCKQYPQEFTWSRQKTAQTIQNGSINNSPFDNLIDHPHHHQSGQNLRKISQFSHSLIHPQHYFFNNNQKNYSMKPSIGYLATSSSSSSQRNTSIPMYFSPQLNPTAQQRQSHHDQHQFQLLSPLLYPNKVKKEEDLIIQYLDLNQPISELHYYQKPKKFNLPSSDGMETNQSLKNITQQIGIENKQKGRHIFLQQQQQSNNSIIDSTIGLPSSPIYSNNSNDQNNQLPSQYQRSNSSKSPINKFFSFQNKFDKLFRNQDLSKLEYNEEQQNELVSLQNKMKHVNSKEEIQRVSGQVTSSSSSSSVTQQKQFQEEIGIDDQISPRNPTFNISNVQKQIYPQFTSRLLQQLPMKSSLLQKSQSADQNTQKHDSFSGRHPSPVCCDYLLNQQHQDANSNTSDAIIETQQNQGIKSFGRNQSLANLPSEQLFLFRLPKISEGENSRTPKSLSSRNSKQMTNSQKTHSQVFFTDSYFMNSEDYNSNTIFHQQKESSQINFDVRDVKTPSFNCRQNMNPTVQQDSNYENGSQENSVGNTIFQGGVPVINSGNISTGASICLADSEINCSFRFQPEISDAELVYIKKPNTKESIKYSPQKDSFPDRENMTNNKQICSTNRGYIRKSSKLVEQTPTAGLVDPITFTPDEINKESLIFQLFNSPQSESQFEMGTHCPGLPSIFQNLEEGQIKNPRNPSSSKVSLQQRYGGQKIGIIDRSNIISLSSISKPNQETSTVIKAKEQKQSIQLLHPLHFKDQIVDNQQSEQKNSSKIIKRINNYHLHLKQNSQKKI